MTAIYVDGCDVCLDAPTARNVRCNLGALDGRTWLLRAGDVQALGPGRVLDGRGCLALPGLIDCCGSPDPARGVTAGYWAVEGVAYGTAGGAAPALCPLLASQPAARRRAAAAALRRALAAGVRILAGSRRGLPGAPAGACLLDELEALVAAGLTPGQAVAAATSVAGAVLGGEPGRIEDGGAADWLLVPGGPLADITALRQPRFVIVAGETVP